MTSFVLALISIPWFLFTIFFDSIEYQLQVNGTPHPTAGRLAWLIIMTPTACSIVLCIFSIWRISRRPGELSGKALPLLGLLMCGIWVLLGLWILNFGVLFWENFSPG